MSGPKTRARLASRTALIAAALTLASLGCSEDAEENTLLAARQSALAQSAFHDFLSPPDPPATECSVTLAPGTDVAGDAAMIQAAVDGASAFDVICLARGVYAMDATLVIDSVASLSIRGAGSDPDDVELDFTGQTGLAGVHVLAPGFWLENVWIHDAAGFGVHIGTNSSSKNPAVVRKVKVSWGADVSLPGNGLLGVFIDGAEYVIVEFTEAIGATTAGILLNTASDVIVRDSYPHGNHVGISFSNSADSELVGNAVTDNVAGILASQSPDADFTRNQGVLVVRNQVWANNRARFTAGAFFAAADVAPVGTGFMVVAGTDLEFRENLVYDNVTTGLLILSNYTVENLDSGVYPTYDPAYDPFPTNVYMNGNTLQLTDDSDFWTGLLQSGNGRAVNLAFRTAWGGLNAGNGADKSYTPMPPSFWDNPTTSPPPTTNIESDDPNTGFFIEFADRPIILDGTSLDFDTVAPADPAFCLGVGEDRPLAYISMADRRGYPLPNGDAPRQDEFDCELPELPRISFP